MLLLFDFCLVTWATQEAGCRRLSMSLKTRSLGKMAPETFPPLSRAKGEWTQQGLRGKWGKIKSKPLEVTQVLLSCPWTWTGSLKFRTQDSSGPKALLHLTLVAIYPDPWVTDQGRIDPLSQRLGCSHHSMGASTGI